MRVRSLSVYPRDHSAGELWQSHGHSAAAHISPGMQYLVLGITCRVASSLGGAGAHVEVEDNDGHLLSLPLAVFTIVDDRVSALWRARCHHHGALTLWPLPFYRPGFHEELSEGIPAAVDELARVREALEREFLPHPGSFMTSGEREALATFLSRGWPAVPQVDEMGDTEIVRATTSQLPPSERGRLSHLLTRVLDAADPIQERAELIRKSAWKHLPGEAAVPLAWLAGILAQLEAEEDHPSGPA